MPTPGPNIILPNVANATEPSIAVNPRNPLDLAAGSNPGSTMVAYRSLDGGATWNTGPLPSLRYNSTYNMTPIGDPVLEFDGFGNAYYVFIEGVVNTSLQRIAVAKSLDGGLTYNTAVNASGLADPVDKPWIAADKTTTGPSAGFVYVAWLNFATRQIYFSRSTDGGRNFTSPPILISDANRTFARPSVQVSIGFNGTVYVSWIEWNTANRGLNAAQVLIAKSTDFGVHFGPNTIVQAFTPPLSPQYLPGGGRYVDSISMDADRNTGSVYIAYTYNTTIAANSLDINFTVSNDEGVTWSSPITVNDVLKNDQFFPALTVDPSGNIKIAWYDRRNDPANRNIDVYLAESTDGGNSFSANVKVTTVSFDPRSLFIGDYIDIRATVDRAYPIWTGLRNLNATTIKKDIYIDVVVEPPSPPSVAGPFLPGNANGRGLAFNGIKLFATYCIPINCSIPQAVGGLSTLSRISSAGVLEAQIPIADGTGAPVYCGALAWDGAKLWCGTYDGRANIYTVDSVTGLATFQFTVATLLQPNPTTSCFAPGQGFIDGLEFDRFNNPHTLWISDDGGTVVFHYSLRGLLLSSFPAPFATIGGRIYNCNSGIMFDGTRLWLAVYEAPSPDATWGTGLIAQFTTVGGYTGQSFLVGKAKEGITFDAVTFAPLCAVWALTDNVPVAGEIQAYAIPCGPELVSAGPFTPVALNGRAMAFDGRKLYATYCNMPDGTTCVGRNNPPRAASTLKRITTGGVLEASIPITLVNGTSRSCGGLAWDGARLWCGSYDQSGNVYTVDPATGIATPRFVANELRLQAPNTSCLSGANGPNQTSHGGIDGIVYDSFNAPNTLWISDDDGNTIFHYSLNGVLLGKFSQPFTTINGKPYTCNTGIAFDGSNLWLLINQPPSLDQTFSTAVIAQFTTAGVYTGLAVDIALPKEGLAYDSVTFAPRCAVWAINDGAGGTVAGQIQAYQVPCRPLRGAFAPVSTNGRGLAFDAVKLFATYCIPADCVTAQTVGGLSTLRRISTQGILEANIPIATGTGIPVYCGALAWDGAKLWCGTYDSKANIYTVDPASGLAIFQFTASALLPPNPTTSCAPTVQGFVDGLAYDRFDAPNTLWISDDGGTTVFHYSTNGVLLGSFSAPFVGQTYNCNSGIGFDGSLWLALYESPSPDMTWDTGIISQFTTAGAYAGVSLATSQAEEGLAFDSITFAPLCAVWALNDGLPVSGVIDAYQIPCFDFSMSNNGRIIAVQGRSGDNTIIVDLVSGATQAVNLSCANGLPSGASCAFYPFPSNLPTFSSTLVITTSSSTPTGSFTINVMGMAGGGQSHATQFTLTVILPGAVGGTQIAVDKLLILAPYLVLATAIATVATATLLRMRRDKPRQRTTAGRSRIGRQRFLLLR